MKLYTEEQLKKAMLDYIQGILPIDIFNSLTPIELPSDEEIENKMHSTEKYHIMKDFYCDGFKDGAKYVVNKIQGGNK